ncbi:nucleotidyltransferase domain-containing protein [Candidatus Woesearchaeota archaeon]|nr:nucleotidyltransferase domain-containing protein [Candidatus Woesearchaeota archaeon]
MRSKVLSHKKRVINQKLDQDKDIAFDFATKAYKKFKDIIKSVVLFGSVPKKEINLKSDIDIVIIIDDCTVNWDDELIAWYREELGRLISIQKYSKELHINTVTLSAFWEELREGEPLIINIIRYGEVLVDVGGFFDPLKVLLAKGRIRPSPEAVFVTMERAVGHQIRSNNSILSSVEGMYWAMVDAGHAALMAVNVIPPSPEHLSDLLTQAFVSTRRVDKKYVEWYEEVRKMAKSISYGDVKKMKGAYLQELQEKTEAFVKTFTDLTKILIKEERILRTDKKEI